MNHYLVCSNPTCHFVLDVRLHGTRSANQSFLPAHCPHCNSAWSSKRPLPFRALGGHRVPRCHCCNTTAQTIAA